MSGKCICCIQVWAGYSGVPGPDVRQRRAAAGFLPSGRRRRGGIRAAADHKLGLDRRTDPQLQGNNYRKRPGRQSVINCLWPAQLQECAALP